MVPELGHFALIIALTLALVQGIIPIAGAARGNVAWMAVARPAAQGLFVFVSIAFGCLAYSFLHDDFSVLFIATNSNSQLPTIYKFSAIWGGHEGSLLLWMQILVIWMLAVTLFSRHLPQEMVARVLGIMGLVSIGFLLFMLATSNPFERLIPAAMDGRDLNPLLQDPGLAIHPPMLYTGYVGFSVAFAFALSALLSGQLDAAWARWSRPWTTTAWIFLTTGIMLGSWWAYYELGWGGWWFWDPVENASFMPWLVGTALIHSLAVTEKRGSFKSWTVLLAIAAFSLSLLGTFLVRSGVLTSVHAFATDPKRGVFILSFLAAVVGGSLLLFAWRAPKVGLGGKFDMISRESLLLSNNVLLAVAAASVLLGTIYPLLVDALGQGKLSVGPPYFNAVFVPLMAPALFLMGIGPIARWKQASLPEISVRLRWALGVAVVASVAVPLLAGRWSALLNLGYFLAFWIIATAVENLRTRLQATTSATSLMGKLGKQSRSYYGMLLAHVGVAVFVIGVTTVKGYETEKDVRMEAGDTVAIGDYTFRFEGVELVHGPNYDAAQGAFSILDRNGQVTGVLKPEKRSYRTSRMPMTEAAIDRTLTRDLYVSMGEPLDENSTVWAVRVYQKPFVAWIWLGCILMGLGGILAVSDRRYRIRMKSSEEGQAEAAAARLATETR